MKDHKDGNATTAEFVELAGRIAGQPVDDLLNAWLYGAVQPDLPG